MAIRTVSFYEITTISGDRFAASIDLADWLGKLSGRTDSARVMSTGRGDYHSRIWPTDNMMSLSIWRETDDTPELVNRSTAQYEDFQLAKDQTFSETSHAVFFPRNVVGFVRHNYGPFPTRLAQYLEDRLELDPPIALTPLLFTETMKRFQTDVDYARQMAVRLPAAAEASMSHNSALRGLIRSVRSRYGDVDVTLTIQVNGGQRGDRNSAGSASVQADLADLLASGARSHLEKAQLTYRSAETERGEILDFLKDRITMKAEMPIEGQSAASARIPVRDAIEAAYEALRADIDAATGA